MEANGIGGGMFSGINSVTLGLELSPQQNPNQSPNQPLESIVSFSQNQVHQQSSVKQGYMYTPAKSQTQQLLILSDDDEAGLAAEDSSVGKKYNGSPWERIKWTDSMVKKLILVVFSVGDDEAASEGNDVEGKKNKGLNGSGILQKIGKWKSVSKAMMEIGFFVSPQQCEDKFNDLNKRYKRVNDILGKGTCCKAVEDQSLLETMDHLSPKTKEEVKKLLSSKHLFFKEMCAYHKKSCGGVAQHSAEVVGESSQIQQQKKCLHSSENSPDDDYDNDQVEDGARGHDKESDIDVKTSHKRARYEMYGSRSRWVEEFSDELNYIVQNDKKSSWEKRQWMRIRLMHLEEQRMNYEREAYELEKQKMKWKKFSIRKERNMEAEKLANEKMRLENERMVLVIKQTEFELLLDFQQQNNISS
ncbi:46 kDa FK506-binding nuclear protein-like [Heracleum sosnowskyi]|uniref:46 kDa FK506-binding nuclear protein-like n=1 Tax=Heracleum sosnowskyi TaxID=360622 RepID=A0AAD8JFM0_9APIA|nr:46 kDa FK506-binding nuclear protein-like [Heracleum sosnowskyi]